MDPLSITAAAVAFATAIIQTLQLAKTVKGAQQDVQRVQDSVESITVVLTEIRRVWEHRNLKKNLSSETVSHVSSILEKAASKLEVLLALLQDKILDVNVQTGKVRVKRHAWVLNRSEVLSLQDDLKRCEGVLLGIVETTSL